MTSLREPPGTVASTSLPFPYPSEGTTTPAFCFCSDGLFPPPPLFSCLRSVLTDLNVWMIYTAHTHTHRNSRPLSRIHLTLTPIPTHTTAHDLLTMLKRKNDGRILATHTAWR